MMVVIKTGNCNIDDWRLGTGGTDECHQEDIYKDIFGPTKKTYLTKPYTLKQEVQATNDQEARR